MEFIAPGVHADIPEARYHADTLLPIPTLSSTLAREHAAFLAERDREAS